MGLILIPTVDLDIHCMHSVLNRFQLIHLVGHQGTDLSTNVAVILSKKKCTFLY